MTISIQIDETTPILVELKSVEEYGERDVSINIENLFERSSQAINNAMATIGAMSSRVMSTVNAIPVTERPDEVEVEFGLLLKTDANAFVVNAGMEAQITVTLKWQRQSSDDKKPRK